MIVGSRPRFRQIVREVWKPLTVLFLWDVAVTIFHFQTQFKEPPLPAALLGSALALFLGFRTNAAYARWWEARTVWGALINASRTLARMTGSMIKQPEIRDGMLIRQIAFAHAMRCALRGEPLRPDMTRLLGADAAGAALKRKNPAHAITEQISTLIGEAHDNGAINAVQQASLERVMTDIANAQGGMERIKNTPLPNGFRFIPNFFTRLFCIILPITLVEALGIYTPIGSTLIGLIFLAALSIGEDLSDPFANSVHDVPMSGMARTIEIDLLESMGREAPPKLEPANGVLW